MSYIETLTDEQGILGFGKNATVEAELYCTIDPGDPGCWRTPNGDGWPEVPPSVSLDAISILCVKRQDGQAVELTQEQEDAAVKFVDDDTERRWESIESRILRDAEWYREDMECFWEDIKNGRSAT